MRIVFVGNVDFSFECLKTLLKIGSNVVGIVTKKKNGYNSDFKDLSILAKEKDIPYLYFSNINDEESINWIQNLKPDIIFCFGISQLIKQQLLQIAPMGVVGFHPALLPHNRGRHPIIWALALGIRETGSTFFFMDEGADSGAILSQEVVVIEPTDDAYSLYNKIKEVAQKQIIEFIPQLCNRTYKPKEQNNQLANTWRKRSQKDGEIDWRMSKEAILNLIKALTLPYPGATFTYKDTVVKVWKAEGYCLSEGHINIEPGKIVNKRGSNPTIKCYDGLIELLEYDSCEEFEIGDYVE